MSCLYLHLGPQKTFSTYIQDFLKHQSQLLLDDGIAVATDPLTGEANCSFLAPYFENSRFNRTIPHHHPLIEETIEAIHISLSEHDVVVSGETLAHLNIEGFARLRAEFIDHKVEALLVVRDAKQRVPSLWKEFIKGGGVLSLFDWLNNLAASPNGLDQLTVSSALSNARNGLTPDCSVKVSSFALFPRTQDDVVDLLETWFDRSLRVRRSRKLELDRNSGLPINKLAVVAVLTHVLAEWNPLSSYESLETWLPQHFALQLDNGATAVSEYFTSTLDDCSSILENIHLLESKLLSELNPTTLESDFWNQYNNSTAPNVQHKKHDL